jgi:hypothetical protein
MQSALTYHNAPVPESNEGAIGIQLSGQIQQGDGPLLSYCLVHSAHQTTQQVIQWFAANCQIRLSIKMQNVFIRCQEVQHASILICIRFDQIFND